MLATEFSSLVLFICIYIYCIEVRGWDMVYDHDGDLSLDELVQKLGYKGIESYYFTTRDGYIINVERIKREGAKKLMPIILIHGMTACARTYFANKNTSPPIQFADNGYDVWLINSRGTERSRGHTKWNASSDKEFWMFSWQEMGLIDLPTTIDLVLQYNVHDKVILVGHSEGSTVIFVTLSELPEYNLKVALSVHWGVCVYHERCSTVKLLEVMCRMEPELSKFLDSIGWYAIIPSNDFRYALRDLCRYELFKEPCKEATRVILQIDEQMEHVTDWSFIINQAICGGSTRELFHFMQVANSGRFARYDFGPQKNLRLYNSTKSPHFHLKNVKSDLVLWCGKNDIFCTQSDMQKLISQLTNVAYTNFRGKSSFTHFDFVLGKEVEVQSMLNDLFEIFKEYTT